MSPGEGSMYLYSQASSPPKPFWRLGLSMKSRRPFAPLVKWILEAMTGSSHGFMTAQAPVYPCVSSLFP